MRFRELTSSASMRVGVAIVAMTMAFVLQGSLVSTAFADGESFRAAAFDSEPQAEINPSTATSATVTTDAVGEGVIKVAISEDGVYTIASTASQGVDFDTIGYLYDESMAELAVSDDCHADTNFCICTDLEAGTYFLKVTGKERQANASITVSIQNGQALNVLDCQYEYAADNSLSGLTLGTWAHGETTEWMPVDAGMYKEVGYVDRSVFVHAQEGGAVSTLSWKNGLPKAQGRYVIMMQAVGDTYFGTAFYSFDARIDPSSISELDPEVKNAVCGAVSSAELGKYTTVPTNWSTRWNAITAGYYTIDGYCPRSKFEALGGDADSVPWTKGLPQDVGDYVIKCSVTDASDNPYTGSAFIWTSIGAVSHAGSGMMIIDRKATFDSAGEGHLLCAYCGAPCNHTTISAAKGTVETGGSGATIADYRIVTSNTVNYEKCLTSKTTASVPDTVTIDGAVYKVVSVAANAFAGKTKLKSVTIGKNATSIGKNAFKGCKNLTSVTIGAGVKTIGDLAFSGCVKLKTVKLGKSVASIGKNAFKGCKVLTSIPITANVSKIGASAFTGCKKLKTLTVKTAKLNKAGLKNCLKGSSVTTVKVPKAKKKAYAKLFVAKVCGKKVTVK